MKIKINIQIFAIIILFILTKQIKIYAWMMLFALIHEMAHIFVGMMLKLKPKTLEIQAFGIGIIFESFENSEKNKILIAIAGPIMNLIIAIIFIFINIKSQTLIINSNLLLAIFNLLPIYPLDGGRILKAIMNINIEKNKAEDIVNNISNICIIFISMCASILILMYKNIGLIFIMTYLWIIVIKENKRYILKKKIEKIIHKNKCLK